MKKTLLLSALLALAGIGAAHAETLSANGVHELSVKASGDVITARRIARERAEQDAVASMVKISLSADPNDPKLRTALADLRKQMTDNLRTTFTAEGDILTARTVLQVDSGHFLGLARSFEIGTRGASANAKVLFLIDEYYGVGTRLDPSQPLVTEIDYSHDKSAMSDRSSSIASARSASSASASAAKGSFAAASSDKSAFAASSSAAVAGRDRQSYAGSDKQSASGSERSALAVQDGFGGAAAGARNVQASGSRDTRVAGASDSQFAGSQKSAAAGSSSSQAAVSASFAKASASKSASSASHSEKHNDVQRQNDVVNLKVRQEFPALGNAKPADERSALINPKLQQVVADFGLEYTDERDFRVENGRRLTIEEIQNLQKFDSYLQKAARGNYKAKYLVYGQATMHSEGATPSGQVQCSGQLELRSSDVETGAGFAAGTIAKRALGTSDQNCRANLSEALARTLADTIGTKAQRDMQEGTTRGRKYVVSLYSGQRVPGKLRREFSRRVKEIEGIVEIDDGTGSEGTNEDVRNWAVVAKGNFAERVEDLVDEFIESDNGAYKNARFEKRGNRMLFCIEGACPGRE